MNVKAKKFLFTLLIFPSIFLVSMGRALAVAPNGKDGWGWFLSMAVIYYLFANIVMAAFLDNKNMVGNTKEEKESLNLCATIVALIPFLITLIITGSVAYSVQDSIVYGPFLICTTFFGAIAFFMIVAISDLNL